MVARRLRARVQYEAVCCLILAASFRSAGVYLYSDELTGILTRFPCHPLHRPQYAIQNGSCRETERNRFSPEKPVFRPFGGLLSSTPLQSWASRPVTFRHRPPSDFSIFLLPTAHETAVLGPFEPCSVMLRHRPARRQEEKRGLRTQNSRSNQASVVLLRL